MATQIQFRRGTTTESNSFTGAEGEVTVDTTKDMLVVHDGTTVGGFPTATKANQDGSISLIKKDGTSAGIINSSGLFNNTLTSTNTNQALTAAQGKVLKDTLDTVFGSGQTNYNVTGTRNKGILYTNSSSKGRLVTISVDMNSGYSFELFIDGTSVNYVSSITAAWINTITFYVPSFKTYKIECTGAIISWSELI